MSKHLGAGRPSRTCCVYCGARILVIAGRWPSRLACARHAALVKLDPHYAGRKHQ